MLPYLDETKRYAFEFDFEAIVAKIITLIIK